MPLAVACALLVSGYDCRRRISVLDQPVPPPTQHV
jgi:hypothetical protein